MRPPDGAWGIPTSGGDWNGMIGMVKRNVSFSHDNQEKQPPMIQAIADEDHIDEFYHIADASY